MNTRWEKEWTCENVYALVRVQPQTVQEIVTAYHNLVVLDHEPSKHERRQIEQRFASVATPKELL